MRRHAFRRRAAPYYVDGLGLLPPIRDYVSVGLGGADFTTVANALAHPTAVRPGVQIILKSGGSHAGWTASKAGTPSAPIIYRAEPGAVGVPPITSLVNLAQPDNWLFGTDHDGAGMVPVGGVDSVVVHVAGDRCKVLRARIRDTPVASGTGPICVSVSGKAVELGFLEFDAIGGRSVQLDPVNGCRAPWVHHVLFGPHVGVFGVNAREKLQLGGGYSSTNILLGALVEWCAFLGFTVDQEILSCKSSGNVVRFCTFADGNGDCRNRHGEGNLYWANYFYNCKGLAIFDRGNTAVGNYCDGTGAQNPRLWSLAGTHTPPDWDALSPTGQPASWDTVWAGNTGPLTYGKVDETTHVVPARNTYIEAHTGSINGAPPNLNELDPAIVTNPTRIIPAARRLHAADVGLFR